MGIIIFNEVEKSALEDVLNQQNDILSRRKTREDYREPILYARSAFFTLPEEETKQKEKPHGVIFHHITRQKELSELIATPDYDTIIPIIPNAQTVPNEEYMIDILNWVQSQNRAITTIAIPDYRLKKLRVPGEKPIDKSPSLTFYSWEELPKGGRELIERLRYIVVPQEDFYEKANPKNPERVKAYLDSLRTEINKANFPANNYN